MIVFIKFITAFLQRNKLRSYLVGMEIRYQTLRLLYELVKDAPQPTQYQCLPRQLILLSEFDWATIYSHLQSLAEENLVLITQADNVQFSITQEGIDRVAKLALPIPRQNFA